MCTISELKFSLFKMFHNFINNHVIALYMLGFRVRFQKHPKKYISEIKLHFTYVFSFGIFLEVEYKHLKTWNSFR
jgi:hypothetical protein